MLDKKKYNEVCDAMAEFYKGSSKASGEPWGVTAPGIEKMIDLLLEILPPESGPDEIMGLMKNLEVAKVTMMQAAFSTVMGMDTKMLREYGKVIASIGAEAVDFGESLARIADDKDAESKPDPESVH